MLGLFETVAFRTYILYRVLADDIMLISFHIALGSKPLFKPPHLLSCMKGITTHEINHQHSAGFCTQVVLHDLERKSYRVLCDKNCACDLNRIFSKLRICCAL